MLISLLLSLMGPDALALRLKEDVFDSVVPPLEERDEVGVMDSVGVSLVLEDRVGDSLSLLLSLRERDGDGVSDVDTVNVPLELSD